MNQKTRTTVAPLTREDYVRVENLEIAYGDSVVVSGVHLPVKGNAVTAIVGPSGCGKSSLLRSINRLNDALPHARVTGRILRDGRNLLDAGIQVNQLRREIGIVFQKPGPFPFSIRRNFSIPLNEHGIRGREQVEERMREALELTGLWSEVRDRLHGNARRLSGGQQQRLCIARSLALRPRALLLDEPCGSLDPMSTQIIEELLLALKDTVVIVMVTHNLAQARRISDYLAVMHTVKGSGRMLEYGTTKKLFRAPAHPLVAAYLREG